MSFDATAVSAASSGRRRDAASPVESSSRFGTRLANRERQTLINQWERVQPYADRFASAFFDTLFTVDPDFGYLFSCGSLDAQFVRFAHLLSQIVSATDDREELERRVEVIVHRFARDDSEADRSCAIRAAIASVLVQVELTAMTASMLTAWKRIDAAATEMVRDTGVAGTRTFRLPSPAGGAGDRRSTASRETGELAREAEAA
jgi:hypothetical protein